MTTSYESGLLYEAARELINGKIGELSSLLDDEESKDSPDAAQVQALRDARRALVVEREDLNSDDQQAVMAIISKYRRPPTAAAVPSLSGEAN